MTVASTSTIPTHWRDVVQPKEHGSWSLALEPIALGLMVAPSMAGAWIGAAAIAGFLARRPLKIAWRDRGTDRGRRAMLALGALGSVTSIFLIAALQSGELGWLAWLLPAAAAGAVFLVFDLRNSGREELAEIAGAAAFAGISATIVAAAGWPPLAAAGVGFVACARAVPTVMFVRAYIRGAKTGDRRPGAPLTAAGIATLGAIALAAKGIVPVAAIVAAELLLIRAAIYLLRSPSQLRPRTLGFQELALGSAYVIALAIAWRW